jgi:hypothetical protein
MQAHSSAGWFFHHGGLSWSEGAIIIEEWFKARVSLEQRLGTALQTAILLILSLSLLLFKSNLLDTLTYTI